MCAILKIMKIRFLIALCSILALSPATTLASERVISLAPNITEILFALDLKDKIVGVTTFCDYPKDALKKEKIGGMTNPNLEKIVSLAPDIVILTSDGNEKVIKEKLNKLKIDTYTFKARTIYDLPDAIKDMAKVLNAEENGKKLSEKIKKELKETKNKNILKNNKSIFIIWPSPLITAGKDTTIDSVLTHIGLENISSNTIGSYPKFSIEEIIKLNPDYIFLGAGHINIKELSGDILKKLRTTNAVKNNNVFFPTDKILRLSPRITGAVKEMKGFINK